MHQDLDREARGPRQGLLHPGRHRRALAPAGGRHRSGDDPQRRLRNPRAGLHGRECINQGGQAHPVVHRHCQQDGLEEILTEMNQIRAGAIISYIGLIINILIGLIYTPWLINAIGKSDYGLYTLAMSIISLLAFDFGLGNATTKFITQYLAENKQDKINNVITLIFKLYLIVDIIILLGFFIIYIFLPDIYIGLTQSELDKLSKVFLIAALYCIISFPFIPLDGILKSYEKFIELKCCDILHKIIIVTTMSGCLLLGYGLYALVLVNSLAGLIVIIIKLLLIKRKISVQFIPRFWDKTEIKIIFSFTFWVTIAALSQRLIFNIAPSLLGIFSDSQSIAILGVAITIESYVYLFANALNGMFLPKVSRLLQNDNQTGILNLMIKVGRFQIMIIGLLFILLVSIGDQFINVWIGEGYDEVYPCMLLIVFPALIHLPQEIGLSYIIAANKVKDQAVVYIIMGILNILLALPFIYLWDVKGICLSICIAYIIRTIGLDCIFYKKLKLNILYFFKQTYLKLGFGLILSLGFAFLIIGDYVNNAWSNLIINGVLIVFIYIVIMYFFLSESERNLIFNTIKIYHK